VNNFAEKAKPWYVQHRVTAEDDSSLDRDSALQAVRQRFEPAIWSLLGQLEVTLGGLAKVKHVDLNDPRAVGSVLNSTLPDAANAAKLSDHGLEVVYCENGRSNKVSGSLIVGGKERTASFELHLSGPRGGTSKSAHQFASYDIEGEPTFPGFEMDAPPELLFFVACHLNGTGVSIGRAYLKFADNVDQRKIEIHREVPPMAAGAEVAGPVDGPSGTKLKLKKRVGDKDENGGKADKRGDAASSS